MHQIYVANTDNQWFDFLKSNQPLEDVNFWKPNQQLFKAIGEGGLFVFRLKSPRNVIGGYGVLVSSINVPIQFAWDSLGIANGHPDLGDMMRAIRRYRTDQQITPQTLIGCRVLANPVFFEPDEWFEIPSDWSSNIVTGKVYDSHYGEGARLLQQLEQRTHPSVLFSRAKKSFEGFEEVEQARYGEPVSILPRLGQGAFRIRIAGQYRFECAISETRVLPALEAAHIRPYSLGGTHEASNGLLLRKDIHSVLDAGFATITDEYKFHVSDKIRQVFNNGNEYRRLHGASIKLPQDSAYWPSLENLRWHQSQCYVGD
ncbi:HNH endonuclease [Ancylobacter sp. TS-1]|uniref:HNH endonuclease n=1 Tax=Ancylobacter sp. TS-1 TaxID=1850374 RepID=UPI001390FF41|nr:HNH endonuclease [Ancylobacter sp. TS-1]